MVHVESQINFKICLNQNEVVVHFFLLVSILCVCNEGSSKKSRQKNKTSVSNDLNCVTEYQSGL
jgi:hypothetical protein